MNSLYISQSHIPAAGRGVFSHRAIKKGELIERCPTIEIPQYEAEYINKSLLVTYIYYLGKQKERLVLALGFGSVYNHMDEPNSIYKEVYDAQAIDFIASKDIQKDEEITVNYAQGHTKEGNPVWVTVT